MTDTDKSSFSRRWFCASALAVSCLPHAAVKATEFWDEIWDVIVVGSGYAGLAAAIEAKRAGARVLVIEKMQSPGGNSVLSTGDMAVADSPVQHALGIFDDSPERMAEDLLRLGKINDPIRCRIVSFGSLETWQWTRTELGVHWIADALQWDEGQSIARGCMVASRSGLEIVSAELNQLKKLDVEVRTGCKMLKLFRELGAVTGLEVDVSYEFGKDKPQTLRRLRALKGIVLCTGGFGADVAFRSRFDRRLDARFPTDNQPGATAEALIEARRIGAKLIDMEQIQVLSWISADEIGIGNAWSYIEHVTVPFGIWIDRSGRRFVNELDPQSVRSRKIVDLLASGSRVYALIDSFAMTRSGNVGRDVSDWSTLVKRGIVRQYDTLSELCVDNKINEHLLQQTLSAFNEAVRGTRLDEFGRKFLATSRSLSSAPWYLIEIQPKVHHCMGGLAIDEKARVLDEYNRPIKGLFAAGEATGGTFGQSRAPCHSSTDALVTGRIAGRRVAQS